MHSIYRTNAYVLDEKMQGEAGKLFILLTRELGLIFATAEGIRYQKSKLRFALQKYSKAEISLVKGKRGWKIVNATSDKNLFYDVPHNNIFLIIIRMFSLINRLVQGEEVNVELFDILDNAVTFLSNNSFEGKKLIDIECVITLKILNNLGYVGDNKNLKFFVIDNNFNNEHLEAIDKNREVALSEISRALKESQL